MDTVVSGPRRDVEREAVWRQHMAACADSGLSAQAYCRLHGLSSGLFYYWRRVLRRRDGVSARAAFAEVGLAGSFSAVPALEVELAGGRRVVVRSGFDEDTLSRLISVLERVPCAGGR